MITIRSAQISDAEVLCDAEVETSRTPGLLVGRPHEFKVEAFAAKIADLQTKGRYVVAEREGRLVGHALLEPMGLERVAHVLRLTIVVHPGCLGTGVGTALMKDLLEWSNATPAVGKVELHVRATNDVAIRLYRKCGFVEEGRMRNRIKLEDGTYIDDISMGWFPKRKTSD